MRPNPSVRLNLTQMEDRTVMSAVGPIDFDAGASGPVGLKIEFEDVIISGVRGDTVDGSAVRVAEPTRPTSGTHVLYQDIFIPAATSGRDSVRVVVPVPDAALDITGDLPEASIKKAVLFVRKSGGDQQDYYRTENGVVSFAGFEAPAATAGRAGYDLAANKKI